MDATNKRLFLSKRRNRAGLGLRARLFSLAGCLFHLVFSPSAVWIHGNALSSYAKLTCAYDRPRPLHITSQQPYSSAAPAEYQNGLKSFSRTIEPPKKKGLRTIHQFLDHLSNEFEISTFSTPERLQKGLFDTVRPALSSTQYSDCMRNRIHPRQRAIKESRVCQLQALVLLQKAGNKLAAINIHLKITDLSANPPRA